MATSNITNTIEDPSGTAIEGVRVVAKLMPCAGFRTADSVEVDRTVETTSDSNGDWSLALERNAGITPSNSYYQITEYVPGDPVTWLVSVGDSNQTVLAAMVRPMPAASPTYLTQASADARYQALGSLGSGTPATLVPDGAGTAGVATSASKSDHNHPLPAAAPVAIGSALAEGVSTSVARADHIHTGPLGQVGYAEVTTNQGTFTSATDLTNLAVTFTAVAGRRYKITAEGLLQSTVTDDAMQITIQEGSTVLQTCRISAVSGLNLKCGGIVVISPTGGSHTYKLVGARTSGTGNITLVAAATAPAFILIEDIGAA